MAKRNRTREARRAAAGAPGGVPTPGPTGPPTALRRISSPEQARELAEHLLGTRRRHPVVVVSTPSGREEPWIDAEEVQDAVRGYAEVVVLPTGPSSWAFSDALPEGTQVYGGAGRVYPIGTEWTADLHRSPLRFAYSAQDSARATENLISDALTMIAATGPLTTEDRATTRPASGVVSALIEPSRALVSLDDGGAATIRQELTVRDVTIGQLVAPGQRVTGTLDHENRLDVRAGLRRGAQPIRHYRPGDVVLARVVSVTRDVVRVALLPDVTVAVHREQVTTNPSDSLTSLFSEHEIVVARVAEFDGVHPALRFDDVDNEDVPLEAPSLLEGGPPWLTVPEPSAWDTQHDAGAPGEASARQGGAEGEAKSSGPVTATHDARPSGSVTPPEDTVPTEDTVPAGDAAPTKDTVFSGSPVPSGSSVPADSAAPSTGAAPSNGVAPSDGAAPRAPKGAVQSLNITLAAERARTAELERKLQNFAAIDRENADLRRRVGDLEEQNRQLHTTVRNQRSQLRNERQRAQKADRGRDAEPTVSPEPTGREFLDRQQQEEYEHRYLRQQIYDEWAGRISAAEKAERPLAEYTIGPEFLTSLRELEGVSRRKVVQVIVEVLTRLAEHIDARDLHELRTGEAGNSSPVTRADGATCYRAALQRETSGARRLHFWRNGNVYELSRVVHHDDMNP